MENKDHTVMIGSILNVAKHAMGTTISRTTSKIAIHLPGHQGQKVRELWIEIMKKHVNAQVIVHR